jgi:hypothetical protein
MKLVAAAMLSLAALSSPAESCELTLPTVVTAGQWFTGQWRLTGPRQVPAQILRSNINTPDSLVATATKLRGSFRAWATNVLGMHTYTITGANGVVCTAKVTFNYHPPHGDGYDIILSAGQSNEVGTGFGPFSDPLQSAIFDEKILQIGRYGKSDGLIVPVGYWQNGHNFDGLHSHNMNENDVAMGSVLTFARNYTRFALKPNRRVLIVPAAQGSTSLEEWSDYSGPLYTDFIQRARLALSMPGNNRVIAISWDQGEFDINDAVNGTGLTADQYQALLIQFMHRIRTDISQGQVPILMVGMVPDWLSGDGPALQIKSAFTAAIQNAASQITNAAYVSPAGLKSDAMMGQPGTSVHYCAQSQIEIGKRKWLALKAMMN